MIYRTWSRLRSLILISVREQNTWLVARRWFGVVGPKSMYVHFESSTDEPEAIRLCIRRLAMSSLSKVMQRTVITGNLALWSNSSKGEMG
jgi:hypothetical protein